MKRLSLVAILFWNNLQTRQDTFKGIQLCQALDHKGLVKLEAEDIIIIRDQNRWFVINDQLFKTLKLKDQKCI